MENFKPWEKIMKVRRYNKLKFGSICSKKSSFDMTVVLVFQTIFKKVLETGRSF